LALAALGGPIQARLDGVAYDWRARGRRWIRRYFPVEVTEPPRPSIPQGWSDPIIHSWGQTGLFAKLAREAIANARHDKRFEDADLYRAMLDQFGDFCATRR